MVTTRIGLSGDDSVVTVAAGGVLELALPENASTGYRWVLDPPPGFRLVDDRLEGLGPDSAPGASATRVLALKAERAGRVHARLQREWESEPTRHFSVNVELA